MNFQPCSMNFAYDESKTYYIGLVTGPNATDTWVENVDYVETKRPVFDGGNNIFTPSIDGSYFGGAFITDTPTKGVLGTVYGWSPFEDTVLALPAGEPCCVSVTVFA